MSWTVPANPPALGYRIKAGPLDERVSLDFSTGVSALSSPHTVTSLDVGMNRVFIVSVSEHYPSAVTGPVRVNIIGEQQLIIQ